jgi:hypothetical protein
MLTPPSYGHSKSRSFVDGAFNDLKMIAQSPHSSAEQDELARVRDYIIGRFNEMGIETKVNSYIADNWFGQYEVNNITAQINGQSNMPYVLVMAHYDSVIEDLNMNKSYSTGAVDDGYGVATLLQIAEYISKSDKPLINGIKFLLTDSEETGPLEGSKAEVEKNIDYYKDIAFIINIEARGFNGPVMMFQTNKKNNKIIGLYAKTKRQFSNSIMNEFSAFIPNFSDLSPFLENGYQGLNFASFGHMKYYHSDEDNINNVNLDTLQHYSEQILPIIIEFVYNSAYSEIDCFRGLNDTNYFSIFPNIFVSYDNSLNIILLIVSIIILAIIFLTGSKNNAISKKQCFSAMARWFIYLFAFIILGVIIAVLIALLSNIPINPFAMFYYKFDTLTMIVFTLLMLFLAFHIVIHQMKKRGIILETLIGGVMFNLGLSFVFILTLSGFTFLFLLPAFAVLLFIFVYKYMKHIANIFAMFVILFMLILYFPLIYTLYYVFTIGCLFTFAFFLAIGFSLFVPVSYMAASKKIVNNEV